MALRRAGWDTGGWDVLLESDAVNVQPEAVATFDKGHVHQSVAFHAAEDYLSMSLQASPDDSGVHFRFYCTERLDEVLSIVTNAQDTVTRTDYMSLLQDILEICTKTYVESSGELILVKFKDS